MQGRSRGCHADPPYLHGCRIEGDVGIGVGTAGWGQGAAMMSRSSMTTCMHARERRRVRVGGGGGTGLQRLSGAWCDCNDAPDRGQLCTGRIGAHWRAPGRTGRSSPALGAHLLRLCTCGHEAEGSKADEQARAGHCGAGHAGHGAQRREGAERLNEAACSLAFYPCPEPACGQPKVVVKGSVPDACMQAWVGTSRGG